MKRRLWYALECPPTLREGIYAVLVGRVYRYVPQVDTYQRVTFARRPTGGEGMNILDLLWVPFACLIAIVASAVAELWGALKEWIS